MSYVRTSESRFESIPDFPYRPRFFELSKPPPGNEGLRMAYLDEGPRDGSTLLLLHGEPTWSFLYRKMIPIFVSAGYRVVAPDLIGFGRSDKLTRPSDYSYANHVEWIGQLVATLDLRATTLVAQDWGSLIGLRYAMENQSRFSRITIGNGFLPAGQARVPAAFRIWRAFSRYSPVLPVARIVDAGCVTKLSPAERAAYEAPFPTDAHRAGARVFPSLVPTDETDPAMLANKRAWAELGRWERPFLCVFGAKDPILGRADRALISHVPGARNQPHARLGASHFLQEDVGPEWAQRVVDWMASPSTESQPLR